MSIIMKINSVLCLFVALCVSATSFAQNEIKPPQGYSIDIGHMISMLDNLKQRVERMLLTSTRREQIFY
jgi:hypothetical protein